MSGPRLATRVIEARPDSFGARRALGGVGAFRAPIPDARDRGAPRFLRGATSAGGCGAMSGPRLATRVIEARPDSFGARRALGGVGPFRAPFTMRVIEARP